jgi:hypothetical protein
VGVLAAGALVLSSSALATYSVETMTIEAIAERAWQQQRGFAETEAGSQLPLYLESKDPGAVAAFLPFGLFTLFFRPLPWEAHNALALLAAIENVFVLGLTIVRLPALVRNVAMAPRHPFIVFVGAALVMVSIPLTFQWNLGTMARMRTMSLPFLLFLLARSPRSVPDAEAAVNTDAGGR